MNHTIRGTGATIRTGIGFAVILAVIAGCGVAPEETLTPEEAQTIAAEAYIYGFPMVMNYKTLFNYVIDTSNPEYKGFTRDTAELLRCSLIPDRLGMAIVHAANQGGLNAPNWQNQIQ